MTSNNDGKSEFTLYVSPSGDDEWSGMLQEPNAEGTDGPLATTERALVVAKGQKWLNRLNGPVTIILRGGRYEQEAPLDFGPDLSWPITIEGYEGEEAIIDGGEEVTGWREDTVNGINVWVAHLPAVAAGKKYFEQLFVNGRRATRTRLPKEGFYRVEDLLEKPADQDPSEIYNEQEEFKGSVLFRVNKDEVRPWKNLTDVKLVAFHYWVSEHMTIQSYDPDTGIMRVKQAPWHPLIDDVRHDRLARYYVENVFEALDTPGEWYLDRADGKLYYVPLPGETIEESRVFAPRLVSLVRIQGNPDEREWVEQIRFRNLVFEHTAQHPRGHRIVGGGQAACKVPGAIVMEGARNCAVQDCRIRNLGGYGVEIGDGCQGIHIVGNEIRNMAAGGIRQGGSDFKGPLDRRTGHNLITDNDVSSGGLVYREAVGILSQHADNTVIAHNHVHDLFYSGISCGWVWSFGDNVSKNNLIEKNHIHDIGKGLLNDLAGIYTLGVQPGTMLRGNLIHDISAANYGGWCIYPDAGSGNMVIENNICYDAWSQPFQVHIGWELIVRNNIFAFGKRGCMMLSNGASERGHISYAADCNILITDGTPLVTGGYWGWFRLKALRSDRNLLWDISGKPFWFEEVDKDYLQTKQFDFDDWKNEFGHDLTSVVADPKCRDIENRDFTLADDSPALAMGFHPIDMSDVGCRSRET